MPLTLLDLSEAKRNAMANSKLTLNNVEGWADVLTGIQSASGKMVNRTTAMRASAVLACVRILMEDVSTLPLILKKKTSKGSSDAVNHPAYRLLKTSPNPFQTSVEVREHIMMDMLLSGRFACWQLRDGKGQLTDIFPLRSQFLSFGGRHNNGDYVWNYGGAEINKTQFTMAELWRGAIMSQSILGEGQALILLAREAIGLAIAAEEQGARLFSNGIQTSFALTTADELSGDTREQLKRSLAEAYAGSGNAWKTLILENGLTMSKVGLTAVESQFIESRAYQMADIARVFRVPGVMLGIGDKTSTYASAEQFFLAYVRNTIMPWTVRIEQTVQRDLLLPSESAFFVKHQLSALLRSDQKTRYENYQIGINAGFLNRDEARGEEDLDSVDGLDEFLMPVGTVTVSQQADQAKKALLTPTVAPGAPPAADGNDIPSDKGAQAGRLAENIANGLLRSEAKAFLRAKDKPQVLTEFFSNHAGHVARYTGCDLQSASAYCAYRAAQKEPLSAESEQAAKKILINLCLGVTL